MAESVQAVRPAEDIAEDIRVFIRSYDPLKQARNYFTFDINDGAVTLKGNVRSVQAHRVLIDNIPDIDGVTSFDHSQFHNDEDMRLEIGKLVPAGVIVRLNFGYVVLAGPLPQGADGDELAAKVAAVPGVRKVVTQFF